MHITLQPYTCVASHHSLNQCTLAPAHRRCCIPSTTSLRMPPQSHTCVAGSSGVSSPAVHKTHSQAHAALNATIQTTHRTGKYIAPNISNTGRTSTKLINTTPLPNATTAHKTDNHTTQSITSPLSKAPASAGKQRVHVPLQPRPSQLPSSALARQRACFDLRSFHLQAARRTRRHMHITLQP